MVKVNHIILCYNWLKPPAKGEVQGSHSFSVSHTQAAQIWPAENYFGFLAVDMKKATRRLITDMMR